MLTRGKRAVSSLSTPATPPKRSKPAPSPSPSPAASPALPTTSLAHATSPTPSDSTSVKPDTSSPAASPSLVLLHPALKFSYAESKAHLISLDPRWDVLMNSMPCGPFEGEQTDPFDPFKSLVTSIVGQQVSWLAARSITHRFVRLFFPHLPEKLAPPGTVSTVKVESVFPTPSQVLALGDPTTTLRSAGLSGRKVEYILGLAERFLDGRLQASKLWEMEDEQVKKALLDVRGIGLWTVHMFLIFSMKRPDIMPVGDLAVQKALCKWYSLDPSHLSIHPVKIASNPLPIPKKEEDEGTSPYFSTPKKKSTPISAYPTPSSPTSLGAIEDLIAIPHTSDKVDAEVDIPAAVASNFVFPPTSNDLTPELMKARLGKKLKGNIYLSPKEMEELTIEWSPFRSVACWYLWSLADGTGDP